MILLYNLFLFAYRNGIRLLAFWNPKAKLWIKGRVGVFKRLKKANVDPANKIVWMHCASLGEYEQGRPVLHKLQASYPKINIVITFFSPSGYEIIKKRNDFEHIFYLPADSYLHARRWIKILQPNLVLWVKYEYWHYYLKEIKKKKIPLLLISGVYRPNQVFFKWYGAFYRNMLDCFTHFFFQNSTSAEVVERLIPPERITVSGDTRCDRVIQTVQNFKPVPGIEAFCGIAKVVVAGSTWEADEAIWVHFVKENPQMRFIIAPHEIDQQNLDELKADFPGSIFYSEWMERQIPGVGDQLSGDSGEASGFRFQMRGKADKEAEEEHLQESGRIERLEEDSPNCLIIDNIGMLSRLYYYATITYVGGGFGADGLHNILEAAVFGKPVIYGPYHHKNFEAGELRDTSGGIIVESAIELEAVLHQLLNNKEELFSRGKAAQDYIFKNAGASEKIVEYISDQNYLL